VVTSQDQRSQIQNREKAMRVLRSRLYDLEKQKAQSEYASARRSQVGTGDRSERIRTYNFPQGRVTDHRIGKSIYNIEDFMNGDLDEMIEALILAEHTALLNAEEE
ncbi:MAG: peptide chain release factor 1, partial [Clostridia bacterium]|nr:peptide chain release factor 1 [Clostridia bacterium]